MHGSYISIIQFKGKSRLNGVEKDNGDGFVNTFFLYIPHSYHELDDFPHDLRIDT